MTLEELRKFVADGEGDRVEFKETTGQRTEACRTLCAFLNGDGGTVVFGVTKKGQLTGQLVSDETKRNLASAFCDIEPGLEIPVEYVPVDDTHQAIVCRVGGGPRKPYVYDGRPYRRLQSSEMWGRGIGLIVNACEKAHLAPPRIYEDRGFVYTVFARPTKQEWNAKVEKVSDNSATSGGMSVPHSGQVSLTDAVSVPLQERIDRLLRTSALTSIRSDAMRNLSLVLKELLLDDAATIESIAAKTGLSSRTVNRAMSTMATAGVVRRDGPDFGGRWIVEEI